MSCDHVYVTMVHVRLCGKGHGGRELTTYTCTHTHVHTYICNETRAQK